MTITQAAELEGLREIGRVVADALQAMSRALTPGMTTAELDEIGRAFLEREGAVSAPQSSYGFPGATCISVNEEIAHGILHLALPASSYITGHALLVDGGMTVKSN